MADFDGTVVETANFLTLHGLWYSLDSGEMVRDQGTGDIQRMVTARQTLDRNQGGPCHQMADSIQTWVAKVLAGDRRAIARAISAVEAGETLGTELLKRLFPASGKAERHRGYGVSRGREKHPRGEACGRVSTCRRARGNHRG